MDNRRTKDIYNLNDISQAERYREKIYRVYFRMKKEDILDELPEKTEQEI